MGQSTSSRRGTVGPAGGITHGGMDPPAPTPPPPPTLEQRPSRTASCLCSSPACRVGEGQQRERGILSVPAPLPLATADGVSPEWKRGWGRRKVPVCDALLLWVSILFGLERNKVVRPIQWCARGAARDPSLARLSAPHAPQEGGPPSPRPPFEAPGSSGAGEAGQHPALPRLRALPASPG